LAGLSLDKQQFAAHLGSHRPLLIDLSSLRFAAAPCLPPAADQV
jgi:hypothetical protein